ncbi:MAG: Flp family type IVb pilin [Tepidibacillus sp.]
MLKKSLIFGLIRKQKINEVLSSKRGDFVQQALIWTLIAIAGITALTVMGGAINDKFTTLANTFSGTNP